MLLNLREPSIFLTNRWIGDSISFKATSQKLSACISIPFECSSPTNLDLEYVQLSPREYYTFLAFFCNISSIPCLKYSSSSISFSKKPSTPFFSNVSISALDKAC